MLRACFLVSMLAVASIRANAQGFSEDWIMKASEVCGGGLSVEMRGAFEADLFERIELEHETTEGANSALTDVSRLLTAFGKVPERPEVFGAYLSCLETLTQVASVPELVQTSDAALEVESAVPSIRYVIPGERFSVAEGEVVAFGSKDYLITSYVSSGQRWVRLSDLPNESVVDEFSPSQGDVFKLRGCNLSIYEIDQYDAVSFISYC